MSLGQLIRVSDAKTIPAKLHCFAKQTADYKLDALVSESVTGGLPALVINITGYTRCLNANRMQTSGVKDKMIMFRVFRVWRRTFSRILSTKVLISMARGATPASAASWILGYSTVSILAHWRETRSMFKSGLLISTFRPTNSGSFVSTSSSVANESWMQSPRVFCLKPLF